MLKRSFITVVMGGLAAAFLAGASQAQAASKDDVSQAVAGALDRVAAEYARHTREHRMAEIQWNLDRQRYGRRGYGPGYGYGRGYGQPPEYGYRRSGPPSGYYRRDDGPWDD